MSWNQSRGGISGGSRSGKPVVYTDGACSNNGRDDARGGIGVYWGPQHPDNVARPLTGRQTNNRAEIQAAKTAIQQAKNRGYDEVTIRTDSDFLKRSVEEYMPKWEVNGWVKSDGHPVVNQQDFRELNEARRGMDVTFEHVPGHVGIDGNVQADRLANEGIMKGMHRK